MVHIGFPTSDSSPTQYIRAILHFHNKTRI
jgi:hypothetical protein